MNLAPTSRLISLGMSLSLALAFAAVPTLATTASAADTVVTAAPTMLAKEDLAFILAANQGGLFEIKTSELAKQRNVNGANLEFAKQMISDHEAVNQELGALAAKKGVTLPTTLDEEHQKKYDALAKTEDSKLAKEYISCQVKAHKKAVSAFKDAASDSKDTDVKAFAAQHLPHLQAHLDAAKRLEDAQ